MSAIYYSYSAWLESSWQPKSHKSQHGQRNFAGQKPNLSFTPEARIASEVTVSVIQEGDSYHNLSAKQVSQLELSLRRGIFNRFREYWSGNSSCIDQFGRWLILNDRHIDSLLKEAANIARISDIEYYLPGEGIILWLNPGQIKATLTKDLDTFLSGSISSDAKGFFPLSIAGDNIYLDLPKYWHWSIRDREKLRLGVEALFAAVVVSLCLFVAWSA